MQNLIIFNMRLDKVALFKTEKRENVKKKKKRKKKKGKILV